MLNATDLQKIEQVLQRVIPQSTLLQAWTLAGGLSAQMTAVELRNPEGQTQRLIIRQPGEATLIKNPDAAANEFRILKHLHAYGLNVQQPYDLDASGEIFPAPYFVLEYIDGKTEFAPSDLDHFIQQFAEQLASIHWLDHASMHLPFLRKRDFAERLRSVSVSDEARGELHEVRTALEQVDINIASNDPSLLHGDFWPGNVLWRDGQLAAVIDWEDAELGDPLIDFAISRLDTTLVFGISAMQAFTAHYQSLMPIDFRNLPAWDLYAVLRAAPHLAEWPSIYPALGRPDITEATMRAGHRWFTVQALEQLALQ